MRGGREPSSALPRSGGWGPHTPKSGRSARALQSYARRPGSLCGAGSPCGPRCRRSALHPGDFPVAGKVTKGAPRAVPFGIPRCVVAALFALAYASRRATFCHKNRPICHFELVSKSVLFFLWFHQGNTLCFQSVARQIPYLRGCREPFYPQPIPLGQKARGSKGARPPSPEVKTSSKSRTRRFLAYLSQHLCCCFPLREKVGRGAGRSARIRRLRSSQLRINSRGARSGERIGAQPFAG